MSNECLAVQISSHVAFMQALPTTRKYRTHVQSMKNDPNKLNLIDLVSECHFLLRKLAEQRWQESGNSHISRIEVHLLARVHQSPLSISEASRILNISRQAMQKCAKKLEGRGYLLFRNLNNNNKNKYMFLTAQGKAYIRDSDSMKTQIEAEITASIGNNKMEDLKMLLKEIRTGTLS